MPFAVKLNKIGSRHDTYRETVITAGSPTVSIDGLPVARIGDLLTPHDKSEHPLHPRKIESGSGSVFIDGLPIPSICEVIEYRHGALDSYFQLGTDSCKNAYIAVRKHFDKSLEKNKKTPVLSKRKIFL